MSIYDLPNSGVYAVVLGIAQDAGLPHAGCRCPRCAAAFGDPSATQYAAALAIVDARPRPASVWLIDATPDIKHQLNLLAPILGPSMSMPGRVRSPDGLFLTHAHMGHTAGLVHLGPEGMNVDKLAIYASAGLIQALSASRLWAPLIARLDLRALAPEMPMELARQLSVKAMPVPHRDELEVGTYAFLVRGPERSLLYVPDIDGWELWPGARAVMAGVDVALVDASFFSIEELGGRPPVAHPLVPDTLEFFADLPLELLLTHLNHTNPLLDADGEERRMVRRRGAIVATTGQVITL